MLLQKQLKKLSSFLILVLCLVLSLSMLTITGFAKEGEMNFTVRPIISSELQDSSLGYFDVLTEPNKSYELQVEVINKSPKEATYEIEITNATTTSVGEVNYEKSDVIDQTLTHPLSSIAKIKDQEGTFKVPANQTGILTIQVTAPADAYEGLILGGVRVKDITERLEREAAKAAAAADGKEAENTGIKIYQEYQAIVAIRLHGSENPVEPNFELIDVFADTFNYRAAVIAQIRNPQPLHVKDAVYSATVTPKGSKDFLFKIEDSKISFAPNSVMDYNFIDNAGTGLQPGTYLFEGKIVYEGQTWDLSKEFVIEAQQADQIKNEALNQQQGVAGNGLPMWLIIAILAVLVLLVVLLLVVLISMKKKNKKDL